MGRFEKKMVEAAVANIGDLQIAAINTLQAEAAKVPELERTIEMYRSDSKDRQNQDCILRTRNEQQSEKIAVLQRALDVANSKIEEMENHDVEVQVMRRTINMHEDRASKANALLARTIEGQACKARQ